MSAVGLDDVKEAELVPVDAQHDGDGEPDPDEPDPDEPDDDCDPPPRADVSDDSNVWGNEVSDDSIPPPDAPPPSNDVSGDSREESIPPLPEPEPELELDPDPPIIDVIICGSIDIIGCIIIIIMGIICVMEDDIEDSGFEAEAGAAAAADVPPDIVSSAALAAVVADLSFCGGGLGSFCDSA